MYLTAWPFRGPGHDSSVGEWIYLTVCPLHGPGSIPRRGGVFQGNFGWSHIHREEMGSVNSSHPIKRIQGIQSNTASPAFRFPRPSTQSRVKKSWCWTLWVVTCLFELNPLFFYVFKRLRKLQPPHIFFRYQDSSSEFRSQLLRDRHWASVDGYQVHHLYPTCYALHSKKSLNLNGNDPSAALLSLPEFVTADTAHVLSGFSY